jgi:hypothetical protein
MAYNLEVGELLAMTCGIDIMCQSWYCYCIPCRTRRHNPQWSPSVALTSRRPSELTFLDPASLWVMGSIVKYS